MTIRLFSNSVISTDSTVSFRKDVAKTLKAGVQKSLDMAYRKWTGNSVDTSN